MDAQGVSLAILHAFSTTAAKLLLFALDFQ
jgi:hypothetical protein